VVAEIERANDGVPHRGWMEAAGRRVGRVMDETDGGYLSLMGQRLSEEERKLRVGRGVARGVVVLSGPFYRLEVGGGRPAWDLNGQWWERILSTFGYKEDEEGVTPIDWGERRRRSNGFHFRAKEVVGGAHCRQRRHQAVVAVVLLGEMTWGWRRLHGPRLGWLGQWARNFAAKTREKANGCWVLWAEMKDGIGKLFVSFWWLVWMYAKRIFEFEWKFLNFLKDRNLEIGQGFESNNFELKIWNISKLIQNSIKEYGNSMKQIWILIQNLVSKERILTSFQTSELALAHEKNYACNAILANF
jgi:hypothetical protein